MQMLRRRRLAWLAPLAVVAVAAATVVGSGARATADPVLPPLTAQELLTRVAQARPPGLSGTFVVTSELGLPALPGSVRGGSGEESLASALALLTGKHTVRVWQATPGKARLALLDATGETDVITDGKDLWVWRSAERAVAHTALPERPATAEPATATPSEVVAKVLAAVEPTTGVAVSGTGTVAGRAVYRLILTPQDDQTLVRDITVSVDSQTFLPLALAVRGQSGDPAIQAGFTAVDFSVPADDIFRFVPPPGSTLTEEPFPTAPTASPTPKRDDKTTVVGSGWSTVVLSELPKDEAAEKQLSALLRSLPRVSGDWGSGRLMTSSLVSAVIADDGRVAVGAVRPEALYRALRTK